MNVRNIPVVGGFGVGVVAKHEQYNIIKTLKK